jgi:DNA-binding NarL/FixJ family response regulator
MPIRILVVDDHSLAREGIRAIVAADPALEVVAEASSGEAAIQLWNEHRPDVTIMDQRLPGISGLDAILVIRHQYPEARFVVVTANGFQEHVQQAVSAGVQGYLFKELVRTELICAIHRIHEGESYYPEPVRRPFHAGRSSAEPEQDVVLTSRELDVLRLVAQGFSNKEIAAMLSLREFTVKSYVQSAIAKLGARDRTHAVTIAISRGFFNV